MFKKPPQSCNTYFTNQFFCQCYIEHTHLENNLWLSSSKKLFWKHGFQKYGNPTLFSQLSTFLPKMCCFCFLEMNRVSSDERRFLELLVKWGEVRCAQIQRSISPDVLQVCGWFGPIGSCVVPIGSCVRPYIARCASDVRLYRARCLSIGSGVRQVFARCAGS